LPFRKKKPFSVLYPNASPAAVDFLNKTLTFDPKKRLTVEQALEHPYLEAYHDPDDEPVAPPLEADFFDFDRTFLLPILLFPSNHASLPIARWQRPDR
jgi:mitogen-activated protein kinase 1/3